YRLRLRANNASTRLTPLAIAAGCVGAERERWFARRERLRRSWQEALRGEVGALELAEAGLEVRRDGGRRPLSEWLRFDLSLSNLAPWIGGDVEPAGELAAEVAEDARYAPYLARQAAELREMRASGSVGLGDEFPYGDVPGLSREMVDRLTAARPSSLADAQRIRGITPAALAAILVHARRPDRVA